MKKQILTIAFIGSLALLLSQCKEEETKTPPAATPAAAADFVKFGTASNIALTFTECEADADGTYIIVGTQNRDSINTGAGVSFLFAVTPAAGNYSVKTITDTTDLKPNECRVFASKTGNTSDISTAIGGQVSVTVTGGKIRSTATNLPSLDLSGSTETISASVGCK
jgi:hypothetical protein